MSSWLSLNAVSYSYGANTVFDELTVEAAEDESVLAIVGPSGIGKSTIIKVLAGHLEPSHGEVFVCGERVEGPSATRPVVFQDYNLFLWKTVLDNVVFGLKCAGILAAERQRLGRELLTKMRLEHAENLLPSMLSGGMQQRVGLARALAVSPNCVLMDEPFSAVDNEMKEALCLEISALVKEQNTRFVIVTHDLSDAVFLGNRILAIRSCGSTVEYAIASPPHPRSLDFRYSKEFLSHIESLRRMLAGEEHGPTTPDSRTQPDEAGPKD
jgi:NitT/TauT family transport system ATP-binding protein